MSLRLCVSPELADRGHYSRRIVVACSSIGTLVSRLTTSNRTPSISKPGDGVDGS